MIIGYVRTYSILRLAVISVPLAKIPIQSILAHRGNEAGCEEANHCTASASATFPGLNLHLPTKPHIRERQHVLRPLVCEKSTRIRERRSAKQHRNTDDENVEDTYPSSLLSAGF